MSDLFVCPVPTALAAAPNPSCPTTNRIPQIQKMLIRRSTGRATLTTATALLAATVSPLLSATDDTKLLVSPWMENFTFPVAEPLKEGGNDNSTLNGVPRLLGLPFVPFTGITMADVAASTAQAMRALASESTGVAGTTNLEAFFVTKDGSIVGNNPSSTVFYGFPIYNFCVTDLSSQGFNQRTLYGVTFDMAPLWSKTFTILTPTDWNALTVVNS